MIQYGVCIVCCALHGTLYTYTYIQYTIHIYKNYDVTLQNVLISI